MICKITGKKIKPFMSFGQMPIANGFLYKKHFKNEFQFKMEVGFSKDLSLFQLNDHPKPKLMFNSNYPFFTSSSKQMVRHFKKYAEKPGDGPDKQSNYKKAPGDATAKTKPSKHTLKFKKMFGESDMADLAKKRIDREKKADAIRHDRMMDRARLRDVKTKNKETKA